MDAWEDWYLKSVNTTKDLVSDEKQIEITIENAKKAIKTIANKHKQALKN